MNATTSATAPSPSVVQSVRPRGSISGLDLTTASALWLIGFAVSFLLYTLTASFEVQWQDSGQQQLRILFNDLRHPRGLALTHPLQFHLGRGLLWVLPGAPLVALGMISVLPAAITIANLLVATRWLTGRIWPSAIATIGLMFAHSFWQMSTRTECYTLVTALLSSELLCVIGFAYARGPSRAAWLVGLMLFNGLGVANHVLAVLILPFNTLIIFGAWWRGYARRRWLACAAAAWVFGAATYLAPITATLIDSGDVIRTATSALVGTFGGQVTNTSLSLRGLLLALAYPIYNFPSLLLIAVAVGAFALRGMSKWIQVYLFASLAVYLAFAIRYDVPDQYTFYLPAYVPWSVLAALGLARLSQAARRGRVWLIATWVTVALTPMWYFVAAEVAERHNLLRGAVGNKPYRNGYVWFFTPWSVASAHARDAGQQAEALAGESGLLLIEDRHADYAFRAAQFLGTLSDRVEVLVIRPDDERPENLRRPSGMYSPQLTEREAMVLVERFLDEQRPVILVPQDRDRPSTVLRRGIWQREGDLYRLLSVKPLKPDHLEPSAP